jgi:signal peptide peptidase SppA
MSEPQIHTPQPPRRVLRAIREHPWAMLRSYHEAMLHAVDLRMQGIRRSEDEIKAAIDAAARPQTVPVATSGSIAILGLTGILTQRADMFTEYSGGTSLESFSANFRQALSDPNITTILLMVDSPGGSVYLVQETADLVFNSRGQGTSIIAVANSMAASAAYWIACQADELVVTPSGEVGSVGVLCMHENMAAMDEMMGVECTYLTYPENGFKSEGNPHEALSEEAKVYLKARIAEYGEAFEASVARGRGVRVARVQKDFGRGRMVGASAAVSLGMADRAASMQDVIDKLTKKKGRNGARAEVEGSPIVAVAAEVAVEAEIPVAAPVASAAAALPEAAPIEEAAATAPAVEVPTEPAAETPAPPAVAAIPAPPVDDARERARARLRLAGAGRAA